MDKILIIDDNEDMQFNLSNIFKSEGYMTITAGDGITAFEKIKTYLPDLVLLDIRLPEMNGLEILEKIKQTDENIIVIMLTAYGETKNVVKSIKLGAYDFITKPFNNEEIVLTIKKALHAQFLTREVKRLKNIVIEKTSSEKMIGESREIKYVLKQIGLIAPTNLTVIIQGGSGTGKELAAQLIHQTSPRRDKPFVVIDCGAIPETLVESELFGHEKGAFTGADAKKEGKFEIADGGTIFLDEIGNLPLFAQAKLLRVIQDKKLQHLGGKKDIYVDVRIITASNINLKDAASQGKFREDLYHRLNEFHINVPLLKERKDDIPLLAKHFMVAANIEFDKNIKGFSSEAMEKIIEYDWPGNVRELKNMIRRSVLVSKTDYIREDELSLNISSSISKSENELYDSIKSGISFDEIISKFEYNLFKRVLIQTKGNKVKAAELLKMNKKTFYRKANSFGL
ncbi:MAG: sigma-54-dependent Fis family transcriptional regulator [Candidatus Firestonebacteria bacterium]|nr:sigma-54-dependent Fis family transcriptional regulator [Candidatus Firestonebacteria bacterium]